MKDCQCFLTSDSVSMQNRRWSDSFSPPPSLEQKEHKRDEQKNTGEI